jgi:hypothetical protein
VTKNHIIKNKKESGSDKASSIHLQEDNTWTDNLFLLSVSAKRTAAVFVNSGVVVTGTQSVTKRTLYQTETEDSWVVVTA